MLTLFTWALAALSLFGVVLNIQKRPACFYVWAVTNFGWVAIDLSAGIYAQAALFAIYTGLAVYGAWSWTRGSSRERFGHIRI